LSVEALHANDTLDDVVPVTFRLPGTLGGVVSPLPPDWVVAETWRGRAGPAVLGEGQVGPSGQLLPGGRPVGRLAHASAKAQGQLDQNGVLCHILVDADAYHDELGLSPARGWG
jgi:hypothetical protein